jgi:HEPN domain-containing protein
MAREAYYGISEQFKAGKHRLDDARALFNAVRWRGCMYLAGYAVECLLKTQLMRKFECRHLRELDNELQQRGEVPAGVTVFTHHLEVLLRLTGGRDRMRQDQSAWRTFNIVNRWIPAWRYSADRSNREDAEDFLEAVEKVLHWIEHNT